ncbi:MAG: thioesterase family protein [Treponema sp.]|jgi:predicted thioesterase|nr:thioesterase family protein [Treponema sp.]
MDFESLLKIGTEGEVREPVTEKNIARSYGSGGLAVYATPSMVALMERACVEAVDRSLPDGFSTVGTELNVRHIAATPLGMQVRARGELLEIEGRALRFRVEAFDGAGKIGEGTHGRFIINNEKFLQKAEDKKAGPGV